MKTIMVPKFSKGTLVTWSEGLTGIAVVEHNSDALIHVKELYNKDIDKLCHLYLYGYVEIHGEESKWPIQITRRNRPSSMPGDLTHDDPMSTTSPTASSPMNETMDEDGKRQEKRSRDKVSGDCTREEATENGAAQPLCENPSGG